MITAVPQRRRIYSLSAATACVLNGVMVTMLCLSAHGAYAACVRKSIQVDRLERSGIVCTPKDRSGMHLPLLLAFHGRGSSAAEMSNALRLHEQWFDAIVVYPEGLTGNPAPYDPLGRKSGWQIFPGELQDRDVHFVDAALEALKKHYPIDAKRVYALGHSNGARFVGILWAMRAEHFAAFAFSAAQADGLIVNAPVRPVFLGMGRKDEVVPFDWQRRSIQYVRDRLGTGPDKVVQYGNLRIERNVDGVELHTYIHPDGHIWPQEQTTLMLDFFRIRNAALDSK